MLATCIFQDFLLTRFPSVEGKLDYTSHQISPTQILKNISPYKKSGKSPNLYNWECWIIPLFITTKSTFSGIMAKIVLRFAWFSNICTILKTWKTPTRSVTLSKLKVALFMCVFLTFLKLYVKFSRFLDNTKSRKASHIWFIFNYNTIEL